MREQDPAGPIYSSRSEEPDLVTALDAFVLVLAERIDALQDHEMAGELDPVASLAQELATEAERLGYPGLGACSLRLAEEAQRQEREAAHKLLVDLTGLAQRVRLGHRGAF